MFLVVLLLGALFALPIGGVIGFVVWRNRRRVALQTPVWQQITTRYGGTFTPARGWFGGNHAVIPGPRGPIWLETHVVSRMQALGSPYFRNGHHSDGGTFTLVRAPHPPTQVNATAGLYPPPGGRLVTQPNEVAIVFSGATADLPSLCGAIDYVAAVVQRV